MNVFRTVLITLVAAIILPQTVAVTQMGLDVLHGGHQAAKAVEACTTGLPCLSAHQPSTPPATNTVGRLSIVVVVMGLIAVSSLLNDRAQWVAGQRLRIRQYLYNRVGIHMHAFDQLRGWISNGLMVQKITEALA